MGAPGGPGGPPGYPGAPGGAPPGVPGAAPAAPGFGMPAAPSPRPRPGAELITAVTMWRLAVAGAALLGVYLILRVPNFGAHGLSMTIDWSGLAELSQLGSLIAGLVYLLLALWPAFTGGRTHEPPTAWPRGALAVLMLLIALTSIIFLNPRLDMPGFFFEHLATPVLIVADFLLVGRSQFRTRWWEPLTWLGPPLIYFIFMLTADRPLYRSLFDPHASDFTVTVALFLLGLIAVGFALFGLTRVLRPLLGRERPPHQALPGASGDRPV